jgi:PDDEXK-like domain of unknown function (DUF3799)
VTARDGFAAYCAIPAVNWSSLKAMSDSPLHYQHGLTHPRSDTAAMLLGRATHCAVLEPDRFPLDYAVWEGDRRGKEWTAYRAANPLRDILKRDEYDRCLAIRDAVAANPTAKALLDGAETEVVREWTDAATGIPCKARLDLLPIADFFADLKTTTCIAYRDFERKCADLDYYGQLAFYSRSEAWTDSPRIIAVESAAPYDVGVFRLTEDALAAGQQHVSDLLAHLAACQESGEFPGRYSGEQDLSIPAWMEADPMSDLFGGGTDA